MPLDAPAWSWVWMRVPRRDPAQVITTGEPATWWQHWHKPTGAAAAVAVRCIHGERPICAWCAAGHDRRPRYVLPVIYDDDRRLLELGAAQWPALALIEQCFGWRGQVLNIRRERAHMNALIRVLRIGEVQLADDQLVDVAPYVSTLGRGALRLLTAPLPLQESVLLASRVLPSSPLLNAHSTDADGDA